MLLHSEIRPLSYALAPVLINNKARVVTTNWYDHKKLQISRPLDDLLILGNTTTSDWAVQNMLSSLDGSLLIVCIEALCTDNSSGVQDKRSRILLFNVVDMSLVGSISAYLLTPYWWHLETYSCFSIITPALSWKGYKMAVYTKLTPQPAEPGEVKQQEDYALVFSLPVSTNLKWMCRKVILNCIASPCDINQLGLPSQLRQFLRFKTC